ncbi:MAG: ATP-binding protein [Desulfurivibrionaceae bacterium]
MSTPLRKIFIKRLNLLAIVSAILLGLLLVKAERMILLSDLNNKGEALAGILAAVTLDAAMVHDYATMERYVRDIVSDPAITGVEIRRADNEMLAAAGAIAGRERENLVVTRAITLGRDTFGEIRITLSTARVNAISRYLLFATFAAVVLFHLLGIVMGNLALKKAVTDPLLLLNRAMEKFRRGNLNEKITITEPAEFATIGHSFNSMADTIRRNFEDIQAQQEKLELEQNKLAAIVDSIADGLFVTDNHGVIVSFNQSATDITLFTEGEATGVKCSDLFQSTLCKDACALNNRGETVRNKETILKTRDGRTLNVSVSSAMLFDVNGEAVGGVQTFRDITLEKKRQEIYCHTEKLATIGQLAAGVAHEINNPLSNILGYARLIRPDTPGEEIERRVAVIVEQARKCSDIVKGLLDFSRSSGAEPEEFPLSPLLEKVIAMLRFQADNQHTKIEFEPSGEYSVYADAGKIEQVVFNLLLNALQTTPRADRVRVSTGRAGKNIYFSVADNGPGIEPGYHQKIFDPFYTTKPVGEGTGLGLSICAGIVAEADGSIDVETREGGGTVFTVLLPEKE